MVSAPGTTPPITKWAADSTTRRLLVIYPSDTLQYVFREQRNDRTLLQQVIPDTAISTEGAVPIPAPQWKAYPNPTQQYLTLETQLPSEPVTIEIMANNGQVVYREVTDQRQLQLSTGHWPGGLYLVRITSVNGEVSSHTVVKIQ